MCLPESFSTKTEIAALTLFARNDKRNGIAALFVGADLCVCPNEEERNEIAASHKRLLATTKDGDCRASSTKIGGQAQKTFARNDKRRRLFHGAEAGIRTPMRYSSLGPEPSASAISPLRLIEETDFQGQA